MASAPNATVISLQSTSTWAAAERHAQERMEAMRRHPSFQSRLHRAVLGEGGSAKVGAKVGVVPELRVCRGETVR